MTKIQVYATSDMHGQLLLPTLTDTSEATSGIALAAEVLGKSDPKTSIRIDNGDTFVGSRLATWQLATTTADSKVSENLVATWLQRCGYDALIPGNHDFDYGLEKLTDLAAAVQVPLVLANVKVHEGPNPFQPFLVFERSGIKIAVIGLITGVMPQITKYDRLQNLTFLDPVETLERLLSEVRMKADLVMVSYHGGVERNLTDDSPTQYDTGEDQAWKILQVPGIDGLITGHQHRRLSGTYQGVPYLQPGYGAATVGVMEFTFVDQKHSHTVTLIDVAEESAAGNIGLSQETVAELCQIDRDFQAWLDTPCPLTSADIHLYLTTRFGVTGTVVLSASGITTWRDLSDTLIPPYQMSVYHMPRLEYADLMQRISDSGFSVTVQGIDEHDQHPKFMMNGAMMLSQAGEWIRTRVSQNPVTNIFDELVAFATNRHGDIRE